METSCLNESEASILCRCCGQLEEVGNLLDVFNSTIHDSSLVEVLKLLTGIELEKTKGKSNLVCKQCRFSLESFYEFRLKVLSTEEKLNLNLIQSIELKIDSPDMKTEKNIVDKFPCLLCDQRFSSRGEKCAHERESHFGLLKCKVCGKEFKKKENLRLHFAIHENKRIFQCDVCGFGFNHNSSLRQHKRIHTGERPYKCDHCEKTFRCNTSLNTHIGIHFEKKIICPECGKGFSRRDKFKVHMRTHTGNSPYACKMCDNRYTRRSALQQHMNATHLGIRFTCDICGNEYTVKAYLQKHLLTHKEEAVHTNKISTDHQQVEEDNG